MILQPTANSRISMRQLIMPSSGFSTLLTTRHYKKPAYFQRAIGSVICEKTCGDLLRSAILGIKEGSLSVADCEKLIFNLDVLDYCRKHIKNKRLTKLISYGMELGDIEQLVSKPGAVTEACVEMEGILCKIIAR